MTLIPILACLAVQQTVDRDIVYTNVGGKDLKLDAYKPRIPIGKCFIAIHGGGFRGGSKGQDMGALCSYLSSRGFTCFDIDYRLQNDVGGTMQDAINAAINDTISAYNWVKKHAKEFGGDPEKISIGGSSAGAITALYATYSKRLQIKSVVDLWGGMYGKETDMKKGDPPLLIVHGTNDKTVAYSLSLNLQNRAKTVGVPVRFLSNGSGHGMSLNTKFGGYTLLEQIDSFLRETIK